jgi:hypothetical protein
MGILLVDTFGEQSAAQDEEVPLRRPGDSFVDEAPGLPTQLTSLLAAQGPIFSDVRESESVGIPRKLPLDDQPSLSMLTTPKAFASALQSALYLSDDVVVRLWQHAADEEKIWHSDSPRPFYWLGGEAALCAPVYVDVFPDLDKQENSIETIAEPLGRFMAEVAGAGRAQDDGKPLDNSLTLNVTGGVRSHALLLLDMAALLEAARRTNSDLKGPLVKVVVTALLEGPERWADYRCVRLPGREAEVTPSQWAHLRAQNESDEEEDASRASSRTEPDAPLLVDHNNRATPLGRGADILRGNDVDDKGKHRLARLVSSVARGVENEGLDRRDLRDLDKEIDYLLDQVTAPHYRDGPDAETQQLRAAVGKLPEHIGDGKETASGLVAWVCEEVVRRGEQRADIRGRGLIPADKFAFTAIETRLKVALKAQKLPEAQDGGLGAKKASTAAVRAALTMWCARLTPDPTTGFPRHYENLDDNVEVLEGKLIKFHKRSSESDRADARSWLDQFSRAAHLSRFRTYSAASLALRAEKRCPAKFLLGLGLGLTVLLPPMMILALYFCDAEWKTFVYLVSAPFLFGLVLMAAGAARGPGVVASHALALRLMGACAIGVPVLAGIFDPLRPVLEEITSKPWLGWVIVSACLVFTLIYVATEHRNSRTRSGASEGAKGLEKAARAARENQFTGVVLTGLSASLALSCLVAPMVVRASPNETIAEQDLGEAFGAEAEPLKLLVFASLVLLVGILAQVFWSERTVVDPL